MNPTAVIIKPTIPTIPTKRKKSRPRKMNCENQKPIDDSNSAINYILQLRTSGASYFSLPADNNLLCKL